MLLIRERAFEYLCKAIAMALKANRCLLIARFQPLHYGHLVALRDAFNKFNEVIVVIGMASQSHTPENPFTAGERILMVRETVKWDNMSLDKVITVTLPTIEVSKVAVHYVKLYSPPFTSVVTLNPIVERIFKEEGYAITRPPEYNREIYRGSYIRKLMAEGSPKWRELVPKPVADVVDSVDGESRIAMLYRDRIPGYHWE